MNIFLESRAFKRLLNILSEILKVLPIKLPRAFQMIIKTGALRLPLSYNPASGLHIRDDRVAKL